MTATIIQFPTRRRKDYEFVSMISIFSGHRRALSKQLFEFMDECHERHVSFKAELEADQAIMNKRWEDI